MFEAQTLSQVPSLSVFFSPNAATFSFDHPRSCHAVLNPSHVIGLRRPTMSRKLTARPLSFRLEPPAPTRIMAPRDSANKNPRKPRKKKNIPVPLPDLDDLLPIDPTVPLYEERPSVPPGLLQMDSAAPVYQEKPVTPPSHAASARQSA
ncbi:hypothetical protein SISSUDRAFT_1038400, partial [Sistotremastrum suecicum HHB10207 ss-3]